MGKRVDGAEPLLKRRGTHRCGGEHVGPRFDVAPIRTRLRQIPRDQPHPFQGEPVGKWMKAAGAERLEAMHEGVHAGRSGNAARETDGQLGIGDHDGGHHLGMEQDLLLVGLLIEYHRSAPDFGAGTGGGRHRHDRCDAGGISARPPVVHVLEVP